jgi:hypothetical protein
VNFKENKRNLMINLTAAYLEAVMNKHKLNVELYLNDSVAVAEHPDIMESVEVELGKMAEYHDKLEMLKEHF